MSGNKNSRVRYLLVFSFLLCIYIAILAFYSYPIFIDNLSEMDFEYHYNKYIEEKISKPATEVEVTLYDISGEKTMIKTLEILERDSLHLILEALLEGPTEEDLENGIISYIPAGTELIGVTEVNGIVFAQFSEELLSSPKPELAYKQIETSILQSGEYREVSIIAGSDIVSRSPAL